MAKEKSWEFGGSKAPQNSDIEASRGVYVEMKQKRVLQKWAPLQTAFYLKIYGNDPP